MICGTTDRERQISAFNQATAKWRHPIQVKQKDKADRPDIDSFKAVMMREECEKCFSISFDHKSDALIGVDAFFRHTGKNFIPLTMNDISEEQLARKLC